MRIGVDAGGTFTDFMVLHDDGRIENFKLRSNPSSPARVILDGLARATGNRQADVVHGSTVATNALLERKGARTAFITTAGFEDLVHIGRQNRPELYNLTPELPRPLVERALCFGVRERTYYDGTVAIIAQEKELAQLKRRLRRAGVKSIAICFLHAYQNGANEKVAARSLAGDAYLSCSHDVCPEFREYERSSTTLLNAYVGPLMEEYLAKLEQGSGHRLSILQSNGGSMSSKEARRYAVRTILSGPAGGVVGAVETARLGGFARVLGFDMGGTSTDVSLSAGHPQQTTEATVDGFPVRIPMLDIHTVGAGGGSIARVDEGGLLRVGPESAGADPGPACYGIGEQPTVTDAHVVLGRISAQQLVGGQMTLDPDRAGNAVEALAARLKTSRIAAAEGIIRIANANMERAIRAVSVERGHDPREFVLVAFGGCGGLHACEIAAQLGIGTVLVPQYAGALSALGMLMADKVRDYAAGVLNRLDLEKQFVILERRARKETPGAELARSADVRYAGQSYELNVPWQGANPGAPFHKEHSRMYGYANPERAIEVVTIRVRAKVSVTKPHLTGLPQQKVTSAKCRSVHSGGRWQQMPVYTRDHLPRTNRNGPALVVDYGATALVPAGWKFLMDNAGNLIVRTRGRTAVKSSNG